MPTPLQFRSAREDDIARIVHLLANDPLGSRREKTGTKVTESYREAFRAIDRDPDNDLIVATHEGLIVGVLQLTFLPHLTYQGGWRAQIEGVRVDPEFQSRGIGRELMIFAIDTARDRGCHLVQLTTDKTRSEAKRFYESLGFRASHEGMKLHFESRP